ncbi:isocitrate lyase/PEP mutase family protein [Paenibacillus chitinolyticus]|uniref:isocitrate lyase/PEP mutase family protein n=1 Tax=Paenibacillus chitinolyticus TaxID=79263 RepID=UPI0036D87520
MNRHTNELKDKLMNKNSSILVGVGVHDAITAKLVEKQGFDFIWVSGLGVSSANGIPDASLLTFGDMLPNFSFISQAVDIPVIADCDNGFGDTANAVFTAVQIMKRTELAGICIEDNPYPKRNSLVDKFQRNLISAEEMSNKIYSIKEAVGDNLFVIARCESLIANESIDIAIEKAERYADAGADAVLIHSKDRSGAQVNQVSQLWKKNTPLVTVPTAFTNISYKELEQMGYQMAIYANQTLRATTRASMEALKLLKEQKFSELEASITPLDELFELSSLPYLKL